MNRYSLIRKKVFLYIFIFLTINCYSYELGNGVKIANSPFYMGGYFSLYYANTFQGESALTVDDIALMLYAQKNQWRFMGELEVSDLYEKQWGTNTSEQLNATIHAERFYIAYDVNSYLSTTLGKFNSPIGFWNLMPINVLRDTTSSPKITESIFPKFTTGVDLSLFPEDSYQITLLLQGTSDLDILLHDEGLYNNFDVDQHLGIGLRYLNEEWSFSANAGNYQYRLDNTRCSYIYGGINYIGDTWRIMGEIGYKSSDEDNFDKAGGYLQVAHDLQEKHTLILRLEDTQDYTIESEDYFAIFGYTYRPEFPIAIKTEYQWHKIENENKLIISFSMLF